MKSDLKQIYIILHIDSMVISHEIRPLAVLSPPPIQKKVLYRAAISSFTLNFRSQWLLGGGMLMHTAIFGPLSTLWGGGDITLPGV